MHGLLSTIHIISASFFSQTSQANTVFTVSFMYIATGFYSRFPSETIRNIIMVDSDMGLTRLTWAPKNCSYETSSPRRTKTAPADPSLTLGRSKAGIKACSSPAWLVLEVRFSGFRADVTFAPDCDPTSWSMKETSQRLSLWFLASRRMCSHRSDCRMRA